jgi:hypothetical protein
MNATQSLVNNESYSWQELAPTLSPGTSCAFPTLCVNAQGTLYGGQNISESNGDFSSASVVVWDQSTSQWKSLGESFNNPIYCMCADAKGNIYVAGEFTDINGCCYVAKYNPVKNTWTHIANLSIKQPIQNICVDSAGTLYVVGNFRNINGNCYVSSYNPANGWKELAGSHFGYNSTVEICYGSGNLYALENITNSDGSTICFMKIWNRSSQTWKVPTNANLTSSTLTLCYNDGAVYILNNDSTVSCYNITSSTWSKTGALPGVTMNAASLVFNGTLLYVAGYNSTYTSILASYDFSTSEWTPIISSQFSAANVFESVCCNTENIYIGGTYSFVLQGSLS